MNGDGEGAVSAGVSSVADAGVPSDPAAAAAATATRSGEGKRSDRHTYDITAAAPAGSSNARSMRERGRVSTSEDEGEEPLTRPIGEPGVVEGEEEQGEKHRATEGVAGRGEESSSPAASVLGHSTSSSPPSSSSAHSPSDPSLSGGCTSVMHEVHRVARAIDRVALILRGELM